MYLLLPSNNALYLIYITTCVPTGHMHIRTHIHLPKLVVLHWPDLLGRTDRNSPSPRYQDGWTPRSAGPHHWNVSEQTNKNNNKVNECVYNNKQVNNNNNNNRSGLVTCTRTRACGSSFAIQITHLGILLVYGILL